MKTCCTCKEEKGLENFSLRSNKKHYVSECKICSAKRSNDWYWANKQRSLDSRKKYYEEHREESLAKWKERYERDKDRILKRSRELNKTLERREKANARMREWNKKNPEKLREKQKIWLEKNPEKRKAHQYVMWAIKLNVIQKPSECQHCGECKKIEAHHEDYEKPLQVLWLCKLCHEKEHCRIKNDVGSSG